MFHGNDNVCNYTINNHNSYQMKNDCFNFCLILKNQLTLLIYSATMHQLVLIERTDEY